MISYTLKSTIPQIRTSVALGCFDGVHIGHRAVITEAVNAAKVLGVLACVCTFDMPPKNYFSYGSAPALTSVSEKAGFAQELGVDVFLSFPFDEKISELSPREFFKNILVDKLGAAHIVCGFNYRFGKGAEGDINVLSELCHEFGITLSCILPVYYGNTLVSSSLIRKKLEEGALKDAENYLGHTFSTVGQIRDGKHLARTWGFPTINQVFEENCLVPRHGVYLSRLTIENNSRYFGITNVGVRPTVGIRSLCAETHIFGFDGNLYGKTVRIEFLQFIRPEKKFSSVEELSAQIKSDIEEAKKLINQNTYNTL